MNLDDDRPMCDFCDLMIEEDESLEPVYTGDLPQPKPHYLTATGPRGGYTASREAGKLSVLRKALHECNDINLNEFDRVNEVTDVDFETHISDMETPGLKSFETMRRDDKVGVQIKIRPKDVTYEPDAKLCPNCAKMLRDL